MTGIDHLQAARPIHFRLLTVCASLLAYSGLFIALYPHEHLIVVQVYIIPVLIAGWAYGLRGTLALIVLSLPLHSFLTWITGDPTTEVLPLQRLPMFASGLVAAVAVGWLFDMRDQLQRELDGRRRAEDGEREQYRFAEALRSVGAALNETLDSQEVLDRILSNLDRVVPHDAARIILVEEGQVRIAGQKCSTQNGRELILPAVDIEDLQRVAQTACPAQVSYAAVQVAKPDAVLRVRSCVAVAILLAGQPIGFLILYSRHDNVFSAIHVERLQAFADYATVAIRNAQMYNALESSVIELTTLYNATSFLLNASGIVDLANQIAQVVTLHIPDAHCSVWLLRPESDQIECMACEGVIEHVDALEEASPIAEALRQGRTVYIPNFARDPRYALRQTEVQSELVIPLRGQSGIVGMLNLQSRQANAFDQRDQRILIAFAERATIAVENMRLYDTIHQFAIDREQQVIERTAELNRAKERVEAILNSSSDTIILSLPDGRIQQSNQAFYDLFEYQIDEEYNWPLMRLVVPDSQERLIKALQSACSGHRPQRLEVTACSKNGNQFAADLVLSPIYKHGSGECWAIVCSLRDISDRKRMEEELRQALAQERELRELKMRFISMTSHEFRTPLATIMATTSLLRNYLDRMDEDKKARQFEKIEQQINYMTHLLNDVLTIGRFEAGKTPVDLMPMYLHEFFEEMAEEFVQTQPAHHLAFSCDGQPSLTLVDTKLMREIVNNLLSNAAKYSPEGSTVFFDLSYQPEAVIFSVRDEGIGIPEADQTHLFEAFHRAENVGTTPGTGLGLSIVKHAVEVHGGTITVESQVNRGTAFIVRIPTQFSKG